MFFLVWGSFFPFVFFSFWFLFSFSIFFLFGFSFFLVCGTIFRLCFFSRLGHHFFFMTSRLVAFFFPLSAGISPRPMCWVWTPRQIDASKNSFDTHTHTHT